ncbi:hypothetical protein glysoja_047499 [Glycine soja]|uniref:Uncharacterized protein n=1 Tax=Glycine soja TaxID=3848 RepID=A0A0B2SBU2_GLYSO|nr:hypothetical protein glysoja_047499 [Glycine soja]
MAAKKAWRIIPRPLLETILNNHVQHHRVPQLLLLHGPRGVGKTTLINQRLLPEWNKGPHITGYVDFAESIKAHHGPWASWPKLVINNIEVLKHAAENDESSVSGPLYHDSLVWRIMALGADKLCLPVILVTSDSYYSYEAFLEFGYMEIFISRETFGWTPQEAKMHLVTDYFSHSEWKVIAEVLGPNPRHLFELYALKQSNYYQKPTEDKASTFVDIVDAYIAYLQVGLLYAQRDPPFLRPISKGIQRCLVRW